MKIVREDGHITYYYYKKKKGRHKKTGPKKKNIRKNKYISKGPKVWDYKIIQTDEKKQVGYVGKYHNLEEVNKIKKFLLEKNENVSFPQRYISNKKKNKIQLSYNGEFVVLKRIREVAESHKTVLRNEFGKLVDHITTSEHWKVYDKFPYEKEETFWVYGYNPISDRKDITWIHSNLIDNKLYDCGMVVQIILYNNKLLFNYNDTDFEFVICKNIDDSIRMYNFLEDKYKKIKFVMFCGYANKKTEKTNEIVKKLIEKTGWPANKIYKTYT